MIRIHIESVTRDLAYADTKTVLSKLRNIELTATAEDAEAILMTDDDPTLIRRSPAWRRYPDKCVAINAGDILSYYIPALYPSNYRCLLSRHRALTTSFYTYTAEDSRLRNAWINRLAGTTPERRFLYSFMGGSTCWLRKKLFRQYAGHGMNDVLIECTDGYKHWDSAVNAARDTRQRHYVDTMLSTKFAVCPRGASASSIRLFEAMELGCAPVVLADSWIPVSGIDWSFCLFLKESSLKDLDRIIRSHAGEWESRAAAARRTYAAHFAVATLGDLLERQIRWLLVMRNERRERMVRAIYPLYVARRKTVHAIRTAARSLVLQGFRLLGRRFPYELNR